MPLSKQESLNLRQKLIGEPCQLFFRQNPLKIVRAKGQYMYDEKDDSYLDCINNVAHVGHCHPEVVKAGSEQMASLSTNNRYLHDNILLCAQRILSTMPDELSVCYFVNSGSEANDLALRLAQIHTGNKDVIALEHAYHGHLTSLIDISHYKFNLPGGVGKKEHVHVAPLPDSYRGKYRDTEYPKENIGHAYADDVREICQKVQEKGDGVSAFIAESLVSCGGQVIPPKNYFNEYGGNPVSCAIANAVFDTIVNENLRENAVVVGEYLLDNCQLLGKKHKCIGDVRGVGLFVGIDLVKDRATRVPNTDCAKFVLQRMREEHILISLDGPHGNIIKFKPPMVFTKENVDEVVSTLDRVFKEWRHQEELYDVNTHKPSIHVSESTKTTKEHRPMGSLFKDSNIKSI
ncbi:unnamed protein product [Diabrotica balteata]|uniref:Uncharacterized protein n=1 Tax=Diabrotica balteata TaxID=107213 RepID=A0A9P0DT60_DIABA|nr:unnamed protein product [Diabrotica balteata]